VLIRKRACPQKSLTKVFPKGLKGDNSLEYGAFRGEEENGLRREKVLLFARRERSSAEN